MPAAGQTMRVDFSKYNLKIGVREEFLSQLPDMLFGDLGVTHIVSEHGGDMKSLEHYLGDHVARSENTVSLKSPVQVESKMYLPSSTRSIIFDYSFNGRDTATLSFYQMRSDLLVNGPRGAPTVFSPTDVDKVLKERGVQYPKTPDKFFTVFTSNNYVEKVAAPPKPQVAYHRPETKPKPVLKKIEKRPEPAKNYAAKAARAPKPRKFYETKRREIVKKAPVPLYVGEELSPNESKIIEIFKETNGPVDYFDAKEASNMKGKEFRDSFHSVLDRGLTKRFVQGSKITYELAYRK